MITTKDIDEAYPETQEGTLYQDMYRQVHGKRPKGLTWPSEDEFFDDYEKLSKKLAAKDDDWGSDEDLDEDELTVELGYDPLGGRRSNWDWD